MPLKHGNISHTFTFYSFLHVTLWNLQAWLFKYFQIEQWGFREFFLMYYNISYNQLLPEVNISLIVKSLTYWFKTQALTQFLRDFSLFRKVWNSILFLIIWIIRANFTHKKKKWLRECVRKKRVWIWEQSYNSEQ